MTLKICHIRLRVSTTDGLYGADIPLKDGLTVLWADNTKGKSTALQAVVYALGLEKMLSPRREIPLPYAMTSYVERDGRSDHAEVLSSSVWLEIENGQGRRVAIRRRVKAETSNKIISVFDGPLLSQPDMHGAQSDYFAVDPGSATREAGFHTFLARFIGWELPMVARYDGGESPLYLESLFPLFYVEQKAGWSAFPAAFPTYFGLREIGRRAIEFVLGLHTHHNELERQRLSGAILDFRSQWVAKRGELLGAVAAAGGESNRLPSNPDTAFEELPDSFVTVDVDGQMVPLEAGIALLTERIKVQRVAEVPTSNEVAPEVQRRLDVLSDALAQQAGLRASLIRDQSLEETQLQAVLDRLSSIEEDLQKNRDVQKLKALGSDIASMDVTHSCPTCDQPIEDTLLPQIGGAEIMPIDDNIAFLNAQRSLFVRMRDQSRELIRQASQQVQRVTGIINETSAQIRSLKADLVAPGNSPSESTIEERLRTERRRDTLQQLSDLVSAFKSDLRELSAEYSGTALALLQLPKDNLTDDDRNKLSAFVTIVREQLTAFGFSTFPPNELELSGNYRLEKEGFEIGFQTSASDAIRLKWAYQLALLELARTRATNHLGLLIFDEPRQQEAAKGSFDALLRRAAASVNFGQQVLFATSEDRAELSSALAGLPAGFQMIEGWVIKPIPQD